MLPFNVFKILYKIYLLTRGGLKCALLFSKQFTIEIINFLADDDVSFAIAVVHKSTLDVYRSIVIGNRWRSNKNTT